MKLIVGLGNPGAEYKNTRHNLGWLMLDELYQKLGVFGPWKKSAKFKGEVAQSEGKETLLLKPRAFMNESGRSVAAAMNFYKIKPENLTVIHDDFDLPLGSFKLQANRGAAGHHGVESVIESLGTKNFTRLRLGIRPDLAKKLAPDFVLGKFTKKENELVKKAMDSISQFINLRL